MNLYRWARKRTQEPKTSKNRLRSLFFFQVFILSCCITPTAFAADELPSLGFANVASVANGSISISDIKTSPDILVRGGIKVSSAVGSSFNTKASIFQDDSVTISARFDLPEGNPHLGKVAQMLIVGFYSPASDGAVCSGKSGPGSSYYRLVNTLKNHTVQEQSNWYSGWTRSSTLPRDFVEWNGSFNNLTPFRKDNVLQDKVTLQKQNVIEMMTDSKFPSKLDGVLCLTFGYKVDVGGKTELVFNQTSVDVNFAKGERANVKDLPLAFSNTPTLNQPVQMSLSDADTVKYENTQWRLLQQPATSSAVLQASGNTASVTPTVAGEYVVEVTTTVNGQAAVSTQNFIVSQVFVYSADKIDNPGGKPLDETVVRVKNQLWVASSSLDEQGLRELVAQQQFNAVFQVKGYDSTLKLLLVEFDDASPNAAAKVEELRLAEGVTEVFYRTIEGKNFMKPSKLPPSVTDANSFFTDDNWHLNKINVSEAWDITTGSQDFLIAIIDDGFLGSHQDLQGRFAVGIMGNDHLGEFLGEKGTYLKSPPSFDFDSSIIGNHGTETMGVIAANANQLGTTGINWQTKIVAATETPVFMGRALGTAQNGKVVRLWNRSMGNYLPVNFDPTDPQKSTSVYEELVLDRLFWRSAYSEHKDVLFVESAGNGVGNAASENGIYGVDAKYGNGYLHYSNPKDRIPTTIPNRKDTDTFNPLENLLVVGALARKGYLEYYSNFGESVEIAAPTDFSSTTAGKQTKLSSVVNTVTSKRLDIVQALLPNSSETGNFTGTSAAAPVVTGVASLVYSVNPNLSAATVKQILINSATDNKVCDRYTNPERTASEKLPKNQCIPIVNAANAVKMAQSLSLKAQASVADPFKAEAVVTFKPQFSSYQLANLKVTGLEAYTADGKSGNVIPAVRIEGNQAIISLKTSLPVYKLKVSATLTDTQGKSIEAASEYAFAVDHVTVQANETGTNLPVGSAQIALESRNGKYSGVTDEKGKVDVWFMDKPLVDLAILATQQTIVGALEQLTKNSLGLSYKFIGKKAGYKTVATLLSMSTGYENSVALTMDKLVTEPLVTKKPNPPTYSIVPSNNTVRWNWGAVENAQGYFINIYIDDIFNSTVNVKSDTTTYTATALESGKKYCYQLVVQVDNIKSDPVPANKSCMVASPNPSTNVKATAGDQKVDLTWNAIDGATYLLYKLDGKDDTLIEKLTLSSDPRYTDTVVEANREYCYQVITVVNGAPSRGSNKVCATPVKLVGKPNPPTNLKVTAQNRASHLEWDAVNGAERYDIYRHYVGEELISSSSIKPVDGKISYNDSKLQAGRLVCYRVSVVVNGIASEKSDGTYSKDSNACAIPFVSYQIKVIDFETREPIEKAVVYPDGSVASVTGKDGFNQNFSMYGSGFAVKATGYRDYRGTSESATDTPFITAEMVKENIKQLECTKGKQSGAGKSNVPEPYLIVLGNSKTINFTSDAKNTFPDRFVIEYEGKVVLDTGCKIKGRSELLTFSGSSNEALLKVTPNCDGKQNETSWSFTIEKCE